MNIMTAAILKSLSINSRFKDIRVFDKLESTNTTAKNLANNGASDGTVIIAKEQTAGKGRLGRSFYSPSNTGVYLSTILRLNLDINCALLITSGAAVAVCRAIKKTYSIDAQIKWVNDIYINNKKVCGILTETAISNNEGGLAYIVLGIGVNISTNDFPDDISNTAGSLLQEKSSSEINDFIAELLNQLDLIINDLQSRNFINEYKDLSCVIGNEINVISLNKQPYIATAIDINNDGHLIVKLANGDIKELSTGEISIRVI